MKGFRLMVWALALLWAPLAWAQAQAQAPRTDCPQWRTAPCPQMTTRFEEVQGLGERFIALEAQVAKMDKQHQFLGEIRHSTAPIPRLAAAIKELSVRVGALEVAAGKTAGIVESKGLLADRLARLEGRVAGLVKP